MLGNKMPSLESGFEDDIDDMYAEAREADKKRLEVKANPGNATSSSTIPSYSPSLAIGMPVVTSKKDEINNAIASSRESAEPATVVATPDNVEFGAYVSAKTVQHDPAIISPPPMLVSIPEPTPAVSVTVNLPSPPQYASSDAAIVTRMTSDRISFSSGPIQRKSVVRQSDADESISPLSLPPKPESFSLLKCFSNCLSVFSRTSTHHAEEAYTADEGRALTL